MRASEEIKRLQAKINDGTMSPDEPLFILRAQDFFAAGAVRWWAHQVTEKGTPANKVQEAFDWARVMDKWPNQRIPGTDLEV